VWVSQAGQLADPPLQHSQVISRAQLTAGFTVAGLAAMLTVIGWLAHRALNRRRLAAWEADWQATGPRWTPRR
jgi:DNA mismatch repair protein MutH